MLPLDPALDQDLHQVLQAMAGKRQVQDIQAIQHIQAPNAKFGWKVIDLAAKLVEKCVLDNLR
jgi:hypothetical protein